MRLQVRKGTVDGYEWRCRNQSKDNRHDVVRSGQFDSYLAEYMWWRSNGHKLVDENFHKFLASIARVYAPTDHDEMQATDTAGSDVLKSGRPIFDDFFQHLWPYIGNNTANVVFQMVKRL
ncbi:hypothetical protein TNCV_2778291 [Trichonephila clavipes]|nr:hypothetical protein TNCV_2778291 [Trichonephila clavipes]